MIRYILITLSSGLFFSCTSTRLTGLYGECPKHYYACSQYLFKIGNEFEYFNFMDVGGAKIIKGLWEKNHDTLVLNSYTQPSDRIIEVLESIIDTSSNLTFEFYNESIKAKDAAFVRLNSDTSKAYLVTNEGFISPPKTKLSKLFITPFFDPQAFPISYTLKDPKSNHFVVRTKNLDQLIFITNERFLVTKKGMYRFDANGNLNKNFFYKKVKPSKKEF
jgi:hypothetical protein